jgi:hypothetical protein
VYGERFPGLKIETCGTRSAFRISEVLEEGADFWAGPVLGADELAADYAFAVDDVGFRPHVGVEEICGGLLGVADGDEVDVAAKQEAGVGVGVLVDADGEDGEAGLVVVEFEKRWQFDDAGLAPSGPEVEQDDLAAITGEVDGGCAVGYGEIGGGLAGLGGMGAAVAGGDKGQREKEKDGEESREPHILIIRSGRAGTKG